MKEFATILSVMTGVISIANMLLSVFGKSFLTKEILVPVTQKPAFSRLLVIVLFETACAYFFGWLTALCFRIRHLATQMLGVIILCAVSAWVSVFNVFDILFAPYLTNPAVEVACLAVVFICYQIDVRLILAHVIGVINPASSLPSQTSFKMNIEDFLNISQEALIVCFVIMFIGRVFGT